MADIKFQGIIRGGVLELPDRFELADETRVAVTLTPLDDSRPDNDSFWSEVAAFERLKPSLLEKYPGQFVAIYQGDVVAVGVAEMDVLMEVYGRFGRVPCYVELVAEDVPRRVKMPSVWIVR